MSQNDYPAIDSVIKKIAKEKQPFVRLEMKKEDLLEMFKVGQYSNESSWQLSSHTQSVELLD